MWHEFGNAVNLAKHCIHVQLHFLSCTIRVHHKALLHYLITISPLSGSPECDWSDSGSDLRQRKFPSLLHGRRSAPELPHLPPATRRSDQPSPAKHDETMPVKRKPLTKTRPSPRSPRRFSFDLSNGVGGFSEDEGWNRRRSERIFLHDATTSNQMSVSTSSSTSQSSSSSVSAPPLTPKPSSKPKPTPAAREGKDVIKVRQWFISDRMHVFPPLFLMLLLSSFHLCILFFPLQKFFCLRVSVPPVKLLYFMHLQASVSFVFYLGTQKKKQKEAPAPVGPSTLCSPVSDGAPPLSPAHKSQSKGKSKVREVCRTDCCSFKNASEKWNRKSLYYTNFSKC